MNHFEEFDFQIKTVEDNLELLKHKFNNISHNIDLESNLNKIGNIISIFCHELYESLKITKNNIENIFEDSHCLNYNNILNDKNNIIKEITNTNNIDINNYLNIIQLYLIEYFDELNLNKSLLDSKYDFER